MLSRYLFMFLEKSFNLCFVHENALIHYTIFEKQKLTMNTVIIIN